MKNATHSNADESSNDQDCNSKESVAIALAAKRLPECRAGFNPHGIYEDDQTKAGNNLRKSDLRAESADSQTHDENAGHAQTKAEEADLSEEIP